jgi:hypothetical protein
MALLAIQQAVRDYRAWRAVYDTLDELQESWGVLAASVHQLVGTPDTVLVLRQFATVAQVRGFLTCREQQAAMQRAGAVGTPRVEIYG